MNKNKYNVILFFVLNIFVFFVLCELLSQYLFVSENQILYRKKEVLFIQNSILGYSLKPFFSVSAEKNKLYPGVSVKINSKGYRMNEFDDRQKIAIFGDSVTFGFGLKQSNTISAELEKNLNNKIQVVNAGVPGYNTEQIISACKLLASQIRLKEVIFIINANDFQTRYYPICGGATLTRSKSFPWESDKIEESKIPNSNEKVFYLPIIFKCLTQKKPVYTSLSLSSVPQIDNVKDIFSGEQEIISYYNNNCQAMTQMKEDTKIKYETLFNELEKSNIAVKAAFFPFRISAFDKKKGKDDRFEEIARSLQKNTKAKIIFLNRYLTNAIDWLPSDSHPSSIGTKKIADTLK